MVKWVLIISLIVMIVLRVCLIYSDRGKLAVGISVKIIETINNNLQREKGRNYIDSGDIWIKLPTVTNLEGGDRIMVVGRLSSKVIIKNKNKFLLIPRHIEIQKHSNSYPVLLRERLLSWIPGDEGALAVGLLFGGTGYMGRTTTEYFRRAGISHILSASGYNVSLVASWITTVCVILVGKKRGLGFSIIGIWIYVWLAGPTPAVIRAAVMATATIVGLLEGRETDVGWWLVLTALLMLIYNPLWISDIGFLLSFASMAGLIWIQPLLKISRLPRYLLGVWEMLSVTLTAQLVTMPLILYFFGDISVIAPVSNLAILWLVPLVMQVLGATMLVGVFVPALGQILAYLAWPELHYMVGITKVLGSLEIASWSLGKISWVWMAGAYATIILGVIYIKTKQKLA
ncbi:MAG: ComEC/Rec2-related protein [Candidatus Amesbacteria bacterium GW2011_GWA2_42_12]|uniref:ComEC/Rec2-related protein n=1 Tax=Candidatus Amesbacteria bacterium GW2011_GWA2_42_12 TaxID=1618356 RepID=A0A0G0Y6S7_9BACT|nr:MAG: ComEC/Rec2-related protein [Candidatus Amesbacteria bacterium GW2011_GWA2_42_12]